MPTDAEKEVSEMLQIIVDEYNELGELPDPKENTQFYARILNLLDLAKEMGVKMSLAEISRRLGVGYAKLRRGLQEYKKMEYLGEDAVEVEVAPPPVEEKKEETPEKKIEEKQGKKRRGRATSKTLETRIFDSAVKKMSKRAEDIIKEEVEKVINIGKLIVEKYQVQCYGLGFDSLEECIDAAFTALVELTPRLQELEEKYEACKESLRVSLRLSNKYLALLTLLDDMSKNINTPDDLELVESVLGGISE